VNVDSSAHDGSSPAQRDEQEKLNMLLTCPAQNFYSRFSLAGEMFINTSWCVMKSAICTTVIFTLLLFITRIHGA